ncbi:protein of unknown function [Xenorhabdus nematophila AN6/1]|nr:protein of unknown function [Xenorhabdus nematophila AN6/1]
MILAVKINIKFTIRNYTKNQKLKNRKNIILFNYYLSRIII